MTTLALLVTDSGREVLPYDPGGQYDSIEVVNLTSEHLARSEVVETTTASVTIHDADERFADTARTMLDEYTSFVESLPEFDDTGSLLEPVHDAVPPWWALVDRFKTKSAEFDHVFNVICRVQIASECLSSIEPDETVLLTTNSQKRAVYTRNLPDESLSVLGTAPRTRASVAFGILFAFTLGIVRLGVEAGKTCIALLLERRLASIDDRGERHGVLVSRTRQWEQYGWEKDRYYHRFPDVLAAEYDVPYTIALHLSDHGFREAVHHLFSGESGPHRATLVQARLGPRAYLSVLRSYLATTGRLLHFHRSTSEAWNVADIDASPYLRSELWASLHTVAHALVQYEGLRRELARRESGFVTTAHFESKIGQVATAAARWNSVPIVGIQHGPITPGKLQYHIGDAPVRRYSLPDRIAVDGQYAADVLEDGGFPVDRVNIVGGPRYETLFENVSEYRDESADADDSGPIVVFFGLSDFRSMAAIVAPVVDELDRKVLLKPHPSAHEETISHVRGRLDPDAEHITIVTDDAHDLIVRASLVISSYSSTAIETLAFGKPLICVVPRNRLDPTPFDGEIVPKVRSEEELCTKIKSASNADRPEVEHFLHQFFGPRDGRASKRLAELCLDLDRG